MKGNLTSTNERENPVKTTLAARNLENSPWDQAKSAKTGDEGQIERFEPLIVRYVKENVIGTVQEFRVPSVFLLSACPGRQPNIMVRFLEDSAPSVESRRQLTRPLELAVPLVITTDQPNDAIRTLLGHAQNAGNTRN